MTVSLTTNQVVYTGNGATTQWDITFPFLSTDDLKIYVISDGEKTLITSDFEINSASHILTYPVQNTPLNSQQKLLIMRATPLLQQTSFSAQETLDPDVLENGYDKAMLIAQDLQNTINRCVKIPLENINGETDMTVYVNQINQSITTASNTAGAAQTTANNALSAASSALSQAKNYTDTAVSSLATQTSLNSEANYRQTADTILQGNIDNEEEARQTADTLLDETKLDISTAASIYLSQSDASSTYLSQTAAASTYLSQTSASSTYIPLSQKAAANGVASLDSTSKIPLAQLPTINGGNTKIQMHCDISANWKSVNPTLLAGEWALETDTKKMKIGDGTTAYNSLAYFREEDNAWQKPSDWIDIRNGAEPQSVTFLVGHSADYATYPQFSVSVSVSNSGTYDVYVDGIKQASAVASGTDTTLTWQTLALTSGYDITYPSALRAHIVQVVPTSDSNNVTCKIPSTTDNQGILWVHIGYNASVDQYNTFGNAKVPVLEAITSSAPSIALQYNALRYCSALKTIPTVTGGAYSGIVFDGCNSLKHIKLKDFRCTHDGSYATFRNCSSLESIETENSYLLISGAMFEGDVKLRKVPPINTKTGGTDVTDVFRNCISLEDTVVNFSSPTLKRLTMGGYSGAVISGLKGITVSSSAPFDHTTSPQIDVGYTGLDRAALVNLFNSMPTVSDGQVCNITGATGAANLTDSDLAIATAKGWTITR